MATRVNDYRLHRYRHGDQVRVDPEDGRPIADWDIYTYENMDDDLDMGRIRRGDTTRNVYDMPGQGTYPRMIPPDVNTVYVPPVYVPPTRPPCANPTGTIPRTIRRPPIPRRPRTVQRPQSPGTQPPCVNPTGTIPRRRGRPPIPRSPRTARTIQRPRRPQSPGTRRRALDTQREYRRFCRESVPCPQCGGPRVPWHIHECNRIPPRRRM